MRQGLLSEPQASSGPAAMLLAVSRSPSSIPRRSPCPERCHLPLASFDYIRLSKPQINPRLHPLPMRCHLPLASLNHIHLSKPQINPRLHPLPERCHLPLASLNHIRLSKPQKTSPTASTPGAMPPSSGVPQPHPPTKPQKHPRLHPLPGQCLLPLASLNHIHLTKPQTYPRLPPMLRADVKKISRTDMRLQHSLPQVFRKKIKCIILIDKRIKTSASVYGKYHTKGGFYHGIQTFWKHDLSSS